MAEIALGNSGEFIMMGLQRTDLDHVYARFKLSGVDLTPFYEDDGLVDTVRDLSQEVTRRQDPQWTEAVDVLCDKVEETRKTLTTDVIGDRYTVTRFGLSVPNPSWSEPRVTEHSNGQVRKDFCGYAKYDFLSRPALTGLVEPFKVKPEVMYNLQALAVMLQLVEKPDEPTAADRRYGHSYGPIDVGDRWLHRF
jgi:hypothetical protein